MSIQEDLINSEEQRRKEAEGGISQEIIGVQLNSWKQMWKKGVLRLKVKSWEEEGEIVAEK